MNKTEAIQAMLDGKIVISFEDIKWRHLAGKFEHHCPGVNKWIPNWNINSEVYNNWKLHVEPEIEILPHHVGCRVQMRNGEIHILMAYLKYASTDKIVESSASYHYTNGRTEFEGGGVHDIIAILDEPKPFKGGDE
jgi:hypothetical protein